MGNSKGKSIELVVRGRTDANLMVVNGVFEMFDTHGIPLADILTALKDNGIVVDWVEFIRAGCAAGWKKKTLLTKSREAIVDALGLDYWNGMEKNFQITLDCVFGSEEKNTAPRLSEEELLAIQNKMLANLSDPTMADKVLQAELDMEEAMKQACSDTDRAAKLNEALKGKVQDLESAMIKELIKMQPLKAKEKEQLIQLGLTPEEIEEQEMNLSKSFTASDPDDWTRTKEARINIAKVESLQYEVKDAKGNVVASLTRFCDAVKYLELLERLEAAEELILGMYDRLAATMTPEQRTEVLARINKHGI